MTKQPQEQRRLCIVGSATDSPCPKTATERVNSDEGEPPDMCFPHALACELDYVAESELGAAAEHLRRIDRKLARWALAGEETTERGAK